MLTLHEYISMHPEGPLETWATRIGCTVRDLEGYISGSVKPPEEMRQRIEEISYGAVPKGSWDKPLTLSEWVNLHGKPQQYWADKFGVSRTYLCLIMRGHRRPGQALRRRIETDTSGRVPASQWEKQR